MKKLLSLLLALAIVVSGLTMIGTLAEGEKATGVINGNAEDTTGANWGVIHGGSVTIVEEPGNTTNHVAKFVPTGQYHSPFISLNNALDGAGSYTLSFRVKAVEAGKTGEFNVNYASAKHGSITGVGNTYLYCTPSALEITDQWTTFETSFTLSQAWLDGLKTLSGVNTSGAGLSGATPETIGIRIDGANGAFADSAGYFAYYIDDVKVEKVEFEGVKITLDTIVTSSNYYARAAANFTTADVVDGKIERTYEVYNDSDEEVTFWLRYQGGDNGWKDLNDTTSSVQKTIPGKSKAIFKLSFAVDANGQVYYTKDALAPLANTHLRAEFPKTGDDSCAAGTVLYIRAIDKESDPIYKLAFAGSGIVLTRATDLPDYAVATPVPATPAPTQKVVNGDAEDTTGAGWYAFQGGSVEIVADPDKADNKVAHYVPRQGCKWDSVGFDMGAFIVQDDFNGYFGEGVGKYTVTFRARAEEGKSGTFLFVLNSLAHYNKGNNYMIGEDTKQFAHNTYLTGLGSFDLTDDWKEYTFDVKVTEEFLTAVSEARKSNLGDAKNAYKLILRLDGSGEKEAFADGTTFGYYVDDVTIKVAEEATPTPVPTHAINGDAEGTDTSVWGTMHGSGNSVTLIPEPGNTSNHVAHFVPGTYNYATVFYDITNVITGPGTYNVSFRIKAADAANSGTFELWLTSKTHMSASQVKDLLGEDAYFANTFVALNEATVDVDGDWATYEGTITVEQEFLDMLAALETAGKANAKSVGLRICGSKDAFADGTWAYYLDDITVAIEGGGEEEPKKPTGIEYEATKEVTSADQNLFFVGKKGAFSAADVKDDELTVKYLVKNTGEEAMGIKLELQALVGGKWVGPAAGEVVTIEPGESAWLEYICEVSDGKVEISGEDVAISELFIRFDVVNGDGAGTVAAGTKFIVYASGAEYEALKAVATRPGWSSTTVYIAPSQDGGDMLPVALIATVVVAFVALAVVAKKRKED